MLSDMNFNPFLLSRIQNGDETEQQKRPSYWLITPYFMLYFTTFIINTLVWPLLIMERYCVENNHLENKFLFTVNFSATSCIDTYMTGLNKTTSMKFDVSQINHDTLNIMIVGSVASAILSLASYFLIWKPTLSNCRIIAVFLPPLCILCQCILFSYALTVKSTTTFKIIILAGVLMPSFHCQFQGVFLLFYRLTANLEQRTFKQRRDIVNTKLELSHILVFAAVIFGGFVISTCFDLSYSLVFVLQFTLAFANALYALLLAPISCSCLTEIENDGDKKDKSTDDSASSSEEEEQILLQQARISKDKGLLSNETNLFTEAPMIFSETSYRKELIVIIELSIFTIAIIADSNISGPYLLQPPFELTLRDYGYCVASQGVAKIIGLFLMKILNYFSPFKHSSMISIAALNYIIYYTVLAVIPSKEYIYISLVLNIFGGIAIPTLLSFMKTNFTETIDTLLEISTISSLIVTVGFSSIEYYVYMKTRSIYPGSVFLVTAAMILLGFVFVFGTYFSTTIKNKRRTKEYADQLLNDYQ